MRIGLARTRWRARPPREIGRVRVVAIPRFLLDLIELEQRQLCRTIFIESEKFAQ
jgi:hypothetical protein